MTKSFMTQRSGLQAKMKVASRKGRHVSWRALACTAKCSSGALLQSKTGQEQAWRGMALLGAVAARGRGVPPLRSQAGRCSWILVESHLLVRSI